MKKFVVIAGNIGVGKSTLVKMLCERLDWEPFLEPVVENPYLADFYTDMQTWSFHSQAFFLTNRLKSLRKLNNHPTSVIQDRSIYEDAEIFARNLYEQGSMSKRDYDMYSDLYWEISAFLPQPDLVVYLRASVPTLQQRIRLRGRDYESEIPADYLSQLSDLYEAWIDDFALCPVLTVPADELNYVVHTGHFDLVLEKVQEKLMGKDEVVFDLEEVNGLLK